MVATTGFSLLPGLCWILRNWLKRNSKKALAIVQVFKISQREDFLGQDLWRLPVSFARSNVQRVVCWYDIDDSEMKAGWMFLGYIAFALWDKADEAYKIQAFWPEQRESKGRWQSTDSKRPRPWGHSFIIACYCIILQKRWFRMPYPTNKRTLPPALLAQQMATGNKMSNHWAYQQKNSPCSLTCTTNSYSKHDEQSLEHWH